MKVRIITTAAGWINGQGWSYEDVIAEIDTLPTEWADEIEAAELNGDEDVKYTARYYAEDDEELENVLAEVSIWQSEINGANN